MKRILSFVLSALMVMLLFPSSALAMVAEQVDALADNGRIDATPEFSIKYAGHNDHDSQYEFTISSTVAASEPIEVTYRTFRGTTDESFYQPVEAETVTFQPGEREHTIAIASREPQAHALDTYVQTEEAKAQKYFGVALVKASLGTIREDAQWAVASIAEIYGDDHLEVVDTAGMLGADGSGDMVTSSFNNGGDYASSMPISEFNAYPQDFDSDAYYTWHLDRAGMSHSLDLNIQDKSSLSHYWYAAGGIEYLYRISYALNSEDPHHVYSNDVDTVLSLSNRGEGVVQAAGDLEAWRTIGEVKNALGNTVPGFVPLEVDLPSGVDDIRSTTFAEYCAEHGIDMDYETHEGELVNGYETIVLSGTDGMLFTSDDPIHLEGELTLRPTDWTQWHRYDAEHNEISHDEKSFAYEYALTGLKLHYGVSDTRAPQIASESDSASPRAYFSQSEYVKGDTLRISVIFDEIVSSYPQGQKAHLSIPTAKGASPASFDLELAGGVGTNVLEFTCKYDGTGATNTFVARDCTLTLPATLADMAGNATEVPLETSVSAAFTKAKDVTVPTSPVITAKDVEGNVVKDGGVGFSDITLTFTQPDADPAKDAVVAYDVSLNGGKDWQRVEANPGADGTDPDKRFATYVIHEKGEYKVVARAVVSGDIQGDESSVFKVSRYDEGEKPGTFWIEHPEGDFGSRKDKVIVHREGGSVGEQVVTIRNFRVDNDLEGQLYLSAVKINGVDDPAGSGNEIAIVFPSGYEGTREINIDVWADHYGHKLHEDDCVAGVELAHVREADGKPAGTVDPARNCTYINVPTYSVSTHGIYAYDAATGGPKLEDGKKIDPIRENTETSVFVYPGQTETIELGHPFAQVSGTDGELDLYYSMDFHLEQMDWSFAGMYDVTTVHENAGFELFRGWEDYDNTHDDVALPNDPSGINHYQLNNSYVVGPVDFYNSYALQGEDPNESATFFKAPNKEGDAGMLSISLDSRLPDSANVWCWYLTYDSYAVDRSAPILKDWNVSDKTFYDGNEARIYLEFSEPVETANVKAQIWDENHTKCYATLNASGPRQKGTAADTLEGLGSKYLMLSGFQDNGEEGMPANALLELEVTDVTDAVGNRESSIKPDSKVVAINTDVPPVPDHVADDVPADRDTYGWFYISCNVVENQEPGSFTIRRVGTEKDRQEVFFRTLWGTNDPENPFFDPVDSSVVFEDGQKEAIIKINEHEANQGDVGYYSAAYNDDPIRRTYGVEIYDVHGGAEVTSEVSNRVAWRDVGYVFSEEEEWVADFEGYQYAEGKTNTFQRALCEDSRALPVSGYDGLSVTTSFENAANRYFRLACSDMYTQMHMYQDKEKFEFTADDIYTRIYAGDGSSRELYCAHEDYDNTNHDHCYFPQDVPINSGNTVDDSSYTSNVDGKNVDGRDITRVWRLPVSDSDVIYNIQGYWADQVITEDGWLDYLFIDDEAPRPKIGKGTQSAFYPSASKLGAGDFFTVTVAFDEIVRIPTGEDAVLEVYDASGTVKLGEMDLAHDQTSGDSFRGHTSALCFDGVMPDAYEGGTYVLKLAGVITDMAGNQMDMTDPACQDKISIESDAILPPSLTLDTQKSNAYTDGSGTTWYSQASMRLVGDAANPAGTANYYSLDGVAFQKGDIAEITGENKAQRVWAKSIAPNGEQSKIITSDPIAIDTVAPDLSPVVSDAWTTPPAVITTNARDGGSGVCRVDVKGPGETSLPYGYSSVEVAKNGTYELRAVDNLGNASGSVSVQVDRIDSDAPPMPGVRSAGESIAVLFRGMVSGVLGDACYTAQLSKSDAFTFVPSSETSGSPESYRYSYALADTAGVVQKESDARSWNRGTIISASYAEGGLSNSVSVLTSTGIVHGLGVYVYCEDEAGNSRKDLLVLDCESLPASTNVYVESFTGTFDDAGGPQISGMYQGEWTAESVIFAVRSELVGQNGVDDPSVTVTRIEYSTDEGATWTDVTDPSAIGMWRTSTSGSNSRVARGSFEISASTDAVISERIRFRAVASSISYTANASDAFAVNVDGRTPVAVVSLADANGNGLPLMPAADEFANTAVTVSIQAQAAHDAMFQMSAMRNGVWDDWYPLGDSFISGDTATFIVEQPGVSQLKVRTISSTGLISAEVPFETHIDAHAPKLGLISYAPGSVDVADSVNTFTFTIDDADPDDAVLVSGPKALRYRVAHPDGTVREGEGVLTLSLDGKSASGTVSLPFEESGAVTVFAVDGADNESARMSQYVDESAPELTVTPQSDFVSEPDKWYPSVTFDYAAQDGIGGVVSVVYTEAGVAKVAQGASGSFTVSDEGVYDVVITATDASGKTAEVRYRVQIVEAAVAEVANDVADLPAVDDDKQVIWEARQDILTAVEDYLSLSSVQKAKMPLDQLEKLETLYEIVLPVRSVDRLDDPTGIRLIGLLFALNPSEIAIPDDYWDNEDYPEDGFVLYEFEVKTRDLSEGGMARDELARVVDSAGFSYLDGHMWDVVVEKRTYAADEAGKVVSREIVGSDRWRESVHMVGLFPFADELNGRDIHFVNVAPSGVEEIEYAPAERPSGQNGASLVSVRLAHLSYYGFVETKAAPVVPADGAADEGHLGGILPQTGDETAHMLLLLTGVCATALFFWMRAHSNLRKKVKASPQHARPNVRR